MTDSSETPDLERPAEQAAPPVTVNEAEAAAAAIERSIFAPQSTTGALAPSGTYAPGPLPYTPTPSYQPQEPNQPLGGYQQTPPAPPSYGQQYQTPPPGYQQPQSYYPYADVNSKSRLAAGLFGIFLGMFGVHRFYLGQVGIGVVQLLITVLSLGAFSFVSAIWGLIDGIMILAKSKAFITDASGRPLKD